MTKNMKWILIGLAVLIGLYLINLLVQRQYTTSSDLVFPKNSDKIAEIKIQKGNEEITLAKASSEWQIVGNDSLVIRKNRIDNLFDKVLTVKRETLISKNPEKWETYSVDDSTGTHMYVYDENGNEITHVILGRSKSDWSHNYIRINDSPEVYLTNTSIIYMLNPRDTYWGEKPKPVEPDTTAVDTSGS